jgi:CRP-like cAMP-binding protein
VVTDPTLRLAALRGVPLFRGLGRKTLMELNRRARAGHFEPGAELITEGEHGETLFVLVRGRVAVHRGGEVVGELGASDYFGEMSLIDGGPRAATIVALEDTDVLQIKADDFDALMRLPEVAREILRGLITLIRDPLAKLPDE